jgi:Ca-activated chloride channel homolog
MISVLALCSPSAQCGLRSKINRGNSYYAKQNFDAALEKYQDALINDPESKELHYNLGNAFYKKENYEEAVKEYGKATYSKDISLQSRSYYNTGDCLYRMGKLPESIQFYKKALELDPKDEDAKYNIEFVQKKIKENMEKKPGQQQNQQQQNQQKKDRQQKQQQQDQNKQQQGKQDEKKKQEEKKGGMSKEDAERLLNAFEENEKDAQKQRKAPVQGRANTGNDW